MIKHILYERTIANTNKLKRTTYFLKNLKYGQNFL